METKFKLVLLRHGESIWNKENKFTGWVDVGLSKKGEQEAKKAGKILKKNGFIFDVAFTSKLKRAFQTLDIVLREIKLSDIPIYKTIKLNERHYGALQGKNKTKIRKQVGEEQFFIWRRSYATRPPADKTQKPSTECLKDVEKRAVSYFEKRIIPLIKDNKKIIICSHGSTMRALSKYFDNISDTDIAYLNIPTGIPLIYEFNKRLKPVRHYYLASDSEVKKAIKEVENQGLN